MESSSKENKEIIKVYAIYLMNRKIMSIIFPIQIF